MSQHRARIFIYAALIAVCHAAAIYATEPPKAVVGKARVSWRNLPGVDDQTHSLSEHNTREVVVVAVTCNHCPIAIEYYERMKEFATKYCGENGRVALVAISISDMETDRLPRMKEIAERQEFNFPYLYDESQEVGKRLGATNTPQFFVLNRDRILVYRGAWDDDINAARVKDRYVEKAVEAVLAGRTPVLAETRAKGCIITYR